MGAHLTFGRKYEDQFGVKAILAKFSWIIVLLILGIFYMVLVGFGVGGLLELLADRGIGQPWIGMIKIAGYITAFLSLVYPMYFVKLLEDGLMRHGPVFSKGPFLSQSRQADVTNGIPNEQNIKPNKA